MLQKKKCIGCKKKDVFVKNICACLVVSAMVFIANNAQALDRGPNIHGHDGSNARPNDVVRAKGLNGVNGKFEEKVFNFADGPELKFENASVEHGAIYGQTGGGGVMAEKRLP